MKKSKIEWLCASIIILITIIFLFIFPLTTVSKEKPIELPYIVSAEPETLTAVPIAIPQIMQDIAFAESHNDPTKVGINYKYKTVKNEDGTTTKVKYIWSKDWGKYQINDFYNEAACKKAGFDIYTEKGNEGCAMKMYKESGTTPWNASKYCWSDIVNCKINRGGNYK